MFEDLRRFDWNIVLTARSRIRVFRSENTLVSRIHSHSLVLAQLGHDEWNGASEVHSMFHHVSPCGQVKENPSDSHLEQLTCNSAGMDLQSWVPKISSSRTELVLMPSILL